MKNAVLVIRVLLGLLFLVFGLNGFLHFIPLPPMPDKAGAFLGALAQTGYMFPLIKGFEVLAGLMLVLNLWAPLALVLLAPGIVNIFLFHLLLVQGNMGLVIAICLCELFLAWSYRDRYAGVLRMK